MRTSEIVKCVGPTFDIYNSIFVYQLLETLLHVTMKRQAEISADISARLLRYFSLSCKNLTIIGNNDVGYFGLEVLKADLNEMKPNLKDPFHKEATDTWKFIKIKNMATNNEVENMHIFFGSLFTGNN